MAQSTSYFTFTTKENDTCSMDTDTTQSWWWRWDETAPFQLEIIFFNLIVERSRAFLRRMKIDTNVPHFAFA